MYILGLNCFMHNAAASLIKDGEVVAAAEEERFNRIKYTDKFPAGAIKYCLRQGNISMEDIDYVCFYMKPLLKFYKKGLCNALRHSIKALPVLKGETYNSLRMVMLRTYFKNWLDYDFSKGKAKLMFTEHHLCHAASAFYLSSFKTAAILSIDGAGEWTTCLFAEGNGHRIRKINTVNFPASLGFLYAAVTKYLGFVPLVDEYKVMGLASYGKPCYLDRFKELVKTTRNGMFKTDMRYFTYHLNMEGAYVSRKFIKEFGPMRNTGDAIEQHHADIAASVQKVLEEVALYMADYLYRKTNSKRLCITGGVGLNCVMNGRILRDSPFDEIFVQPAANDAGTSLGAALYMYHALLGISPSNEMKHVYLGPQFSDEYIQKVLQDCKIPFKKSANIERECAELIADNKIVGWFQGRMEFGPRALGARSILANPMSPDMKDIINKSIKYREEFRPFAPSVTAEDADRYFEGVRTSPFMVLVFKVKEDKKKLIPAVTHVDSTARVHTVDRTINPRYWRLIKEFEGITGVPVLLNTSFNVKGEPIVCTPEEAIRCFYSTGMDTLAIGSYLVLKDVKY